MKPITTLTLALALTLALGAPALAASTDHGGMNHGSMDHNAMQAEGPAPSMHDGMKAMEHNLHLMKQDVAAMHDPAARDAAMKAMNGHMTDMHHGMAAVEGQAKASGDGTAQAAMKQMNKDMMTTMKGMGLMKQNPDAAIPMMQDGIRKMEHTMGQLKGHK
jgi:hypothetical protein